MSLLKAFEDQKECRGLVGECMGSGVGWERRCDSGRRGGGRVRAKGKWKDRGMGAYPMPG